MPIYDYQCRKCGHRFEQLVKPDDKPACLTCGAPNAERLFPFSASVSTNRTREKALKVARGKANSQKREKDHADREYMTREMKDHS